MKELKPLFPGREVVLQCGATAIVYPLGFRQIRKFSNEVVGMLMQIMDTKIPPNIAADPVLAKQFQDKMFAKILPYALTNLLDLVSDCVKFEPADCTIDDVPHWDVALIIEAWVIESFGEEQKRLPWIAAVENVFAQVTGKKVKISEIFSKPSSPPATVAKTSSSEGSLDSPT